jgi:hypothetical protein
MIDFPANPTKGQVYATGAAAWTFDGVKWIANSGAPAIDPHYRNRIINGDMSVDARSGGALIAMPAADAYAIDRWKFNNSGVASKGNVGQHTSSALGAYPYYLLFSTTTAYSPAASDIIRFWQAIEGYNFNDAQWGTASALSVVLEFWAQGTVAGTYSFSLQNGAVNRCYIGTFNLPANTWTKVRANIPGDTAGTWSVAGNAAALYLGFGLCVGATLQTATVNAWQAGGFISATGSINVLGAINNILAITGVALMVGSAAQNAEPEFRKYSDNLIDCQRYYQSISGSLYVPVANLATWNGALWSSVLPVTMRASPTVALSLVGNGGGWNGGLTSASVTPLAIEAYPTLNQPTAGAYTSLTALCDADF